MALHDDPRSGFTGKWTSGIFLALISALWGLASLASGRLTMPRRRGGFTFEGSTAVFLSLALVAFAFYLHFHYFGGPIQGKTISRLPENVFPVSLRLRV